MQEHTKELWKITSQEEQEAFRSDLTIDNCQLTVIDVPGHGAAVHVWGCDQITADERARRIVACVNACAGIPTEDLENGLQNWHARIDKIENRIETLRQQRDELLAALERAERKLAAYVGVCKGDKELTDTVLPMARAAIARAKGELK